MYIQISNHHTISLSISKKNILSQKIIRANIDHEKRISIKVSKYTSECISKHQIIIPYHYSYQKKNILSQKIIRANIDHEKME
jgi:hypothetical protein